MLLLKMIVSFFFIRGGYCHEVVVTVFLRKLLLVENAINSKCTVILPVQYLATYCKDYFIQKPYGVKSIVIE